MGAVELVIILIVIVVVIGLLLWYSRTHNSNGDSRERPARIAAFGVSPSIICPSSDCTVEVGWNVEPNDDNPSVSVTVSSADEPNEIGNALAGSVELSGNSDMFSDPGLYIVTITVTGSLVGEDSRSQMIQILRPGTNQVSHSALDRMDSEEDYARFTARDSVFLSDHLVTTTDADGKAVLENTFLLCKYVKFAGVVYVSGDYGNREISATIFNENNLPIADGLNMQAGDSLTIDPPVEIGDQIAIASSMTSERTPYGIGELVNWSLGIRLYCERD